MAVLFGAYGESDPDFAGLLLHGWVRARHDKQFRLTLAWQREQIRLSLEDILVEGVRAGGFRPGMDAAAVAAVMSKERRQLVQAVRHFLHFVNRLFDLPDFRHQLAMMAHRVLTTTVLRRAGVSLADELVADRRAEVRAEEQADEAERRRRGRS